jgi:hypothetical protein
MIVTRKNLAREALDRALEVREEAKIAFNVALCVYGLCDRLGVRVQFVDINMEGLYQVSKRPLILSPRSACLQLWSRTRTSPVWSRFDPGRTSGRTSGDQ